MNALETFSGNHFDSGQTHAFGGPVTGRTLTVVSTGNNDQVLLALHVGFNGFPHAHDLAVRLHTSQRAFLHLTIDYGHFVHQLRVGEGRALRSQVVTAVGGVRVKVFFRQSHLGQVLTRRAIQQNGVGR